VMERPVPAVGQVWRTMTGMEYMIGYAKIDRMYRRVFLDSAVIGVATHCPQTISHTDTFVGQFAGFKIEEDGE